MLLFPQECLKFVYYYKIIRSLSVGKMHSHKSQKELFPFNARIQKSEKMNVRVNIFLKVIFQTKLLNIFYPTRHQK